MGVFSDLTDILGKGADKVKAGQLHRENSMWGLAPPFCICYVTPEDKIFIKRLLYVGYFTKEL
jgi:hypothetical protein